jgi:hypothetical protein
MIELTQNSHQTAKAVAKMAMVPIEINSECS